MSLFKNVWESLYKSVCESMICVRVGVRVYVRLSM